MALDCVLVLIPELNLSPLICAPWCGHLLLTAEIPPTSGFRLTNILNTLLYVSLSVVCLLISDGEPLCSARFSQLSCHFALRALMQTSGQHPPLSPPAFSRCVAYPSAQHLELSYLPHCVSFREESWFQDSAPSQTSDHLQLTPSSCMIPELPGITLLFYILW